MSLRGNDQAFGSLAKWFHWMAAALIVVLVPLGAVMHNLDDGALRIVLYRVHVLMGGLVLVLTLARLGWRFLDRRPPPPTDMPRYQRITSRTVQVLFYVGLLAMTGSGIAMMVLSGAAEVLFGGVQAALPDFLETGPPRVVHGLWGVVLVLLFLLHAGAAVHHHWIRKDEVLIRMLPEPWGRGASPHPS